MSHPQQLAFAWYGDINSRVARASLRDRVDDLVDHPDVIAELRGAIMAGPGKLTLVIETLRPFKLDGSPLAEMLVKLMESTAPARPEPPPLAVPESRSTTGRAQAVRYGRCTKEDASCVDLRMAAHSLEVARSHMAAAQRWAQVKDDVTAARHLKDTRAEALAQADNARALIDETLVRYNFQPTLRRDD